MAESNQAFSEGLMGVLKPVVEECDQRIQDVFVSQADLSQQIELLSDALSEFVDASNTPSLNDYIQKLSQSRQRLDNINSGVHRISDRLNNIQKSLKIEGQQ
eukprot:TRINITY_DN10225_c0_g1_i1.p1 TRINITY_DN10225_c0_g1~~TRINITY_DN10225_c0_g1_i1.p1  ORF type:complete len:116 (-),score=17.29 TRINITY_DN10225_c0_g1_i1:48-353(-)